MIRGAAADIRRAIVEIDEKCTCLATDGLHVVFGFHMERLWLGPWCTADAGLQDLSALPSSRALFG